MPHKMLLFVSGAVLGMIGMATDRNWIVFLAVGVLAVGLLLRFVDRGGEPPQD
jgi:membrane protein implicated in regulation of membrane protease activity